MPSRPRPAHALTALAGASLAFALASPASAAVIGPTVVDGNPTCADINPAWKTVKIDKGTSGSAQNAEIKVTDTVAGGVVSWTSTVPVDAVIVKGGTKANVYGYSPEATSGSGLTPPLNPATGKNYGVSHVDFCYDDGVDQPGRPEQPGGEQPKGDQPAGETPGTTVAPTSGVAGTADSKQPVAQRQVANLRTVRASARLLAPRSCVKRTFKAQVRGRGIKSVTFYADGRKIATRTNGKFTIALPMTKNVRHLKARIQFVSGARRKTKTIDVAAIRCLQRAVSPRFTG